MFIALCGDKGAPGVTTATIALASAWPGPAVAVEASPDGGDLALRLRPRGAVLPETPTVLTVLTGARSGHAEDPVTMHAHVLNSSTKVVPGALLAEQFARLGDWTPLATALDRTQARVFVDVGHVHASSPMLSVAALADVVVVVCRPDLPSVVRARQRMDRLAADLATLNEVPPRLFALLLSTRSHGPADVIDLRAVLGETSAQPFLVDAGFMAHAAGAVRRLESGEEPAGRLTRTDLMQTARQVAAQLEAIVGESRAAAAPSASGGRP
jgi:MinD-like ATPase involved in chromosome partitioning or flagellar assembly